MTNIIDLDEYRPHISCMGKCPKCEKNSVHVYPASLHPRWTDDDYPYFPEEVLLECPHHGMQYHRVWENDDEQNNRS